MPDENERNNQEEMNNENGAREEDIVEDVDADTRDVEKSVQSQTTDFDSRFTAIEDTLDKILGSIASFNESLGIMVENGAVVHENGGGEIGHVEEDSFTPPAELDLLI